MHVMVDLETLGTNPKSVIVSIGAVAFDRTGIKHEFYAPVSIHSCCKAGLIMDSGTVEWWIKQAAKGSAAKVFEESGEDLHDALFKFAEWCKFAGAETLWGNGVDFDNVIIKSACDAVGVKYPINYFGNRCFRTVKNLWPKLELVREGTHHNALDDAIYQAMYLIELMNLHNFG